MALVSTTLALAKAANDKTLKLTSATGIANKMIILCEDEYFRVTDVTVSPTIGVVPGYNGSISLPHENGAPVWYGLTSEFQQTYQIGPAFNQILNSAVSVASVTSSTGYAADTYLAGSAIPVGPGVLQNGMRFTCVFDMVKTAAGTAAATVIVRYGTLGTVADPAILTFTWGAGTAAVDTGTFTVTSHIRLGGTAAIMAGTCVCSHALAATGLVATGASGNGQLSVVSSAFDSTPGGFLGVSFNGGTSFVGTNTIVESELKGY
jgi:hypothetical protein